MSINKSCLVGSPEMQQAIRAQARIAIETSVQNGFKNLIDFLENEYLPNVRPGTNKLLGVFSCCKIVKYKHGLRNRSLLLT